MSGAQREPFDLWIEAGGNRARYIELMREHGHLLDAIPCPTCGETFNHRHDGDRTIATNIFGHDKGIDE